MTQRTILLVEDNPDDQKLTLRALKKNSISNDVVVAEDGQQALDYLFGSVNFYVRKPVDFLEFMEAARQLGLYWLLLNRQPGVHLQ